MPSRRTIAQGKRQSELIDYREMRSDMSDVEKWISTCCQINRKQSVDIATAPTFIIRQQIKKRHELGWEKMSMAAHCEKRINSSGCERPEATFFVSRILTQDVLRNSSLKYGKMIFHKSPIIIRWLDSGRY